VPPALLVGAFAGGRAALPLAATLGVLPGGAGVPTGWLGEFVLGLAASTAVGLALPPGLLAAARARLVPRHTSTGQRGLAALAILAFAAVYSPTDLPSFALVALPPFVGLAAGLALLEFGGRARAR
jgi:Sec-independent protein secretion pathway component TatC